MKLYIVKTQIEGFVFFYVRKIKFENVTSSVPNTLYIQYYRLLYFRNNFDRGKEVTPSQTHQSQAWQRRRHTLPSRNPPLRRADGHGVSAPQAQCLHDPRIRLAALSELLQGQAVVVVLVHLVEDLVHPLLRRVLVLGHRLLTLQHPPVNINEYTPSSIALTQQTLLIKEYLRNLTQVFINFNSSSLLRPLYFFVNLFVNLTQASTIPFARQCYGNGKTNYFKFQKILSLC